MSSNDVILLLISSLINSDTDTNNLSLSEKQSLDVYKEIEAQGLVSVLYEKSVLIKGMPGTLLNEWKNYALVARIKNLRQKKEQNEIIDLLSRHNIPTAVIKGDSAAKYYPNPQVRLSGDIDLFVEKSCYEKTKEILDNNGYMFISENEYHSEYSKNNCEFEIHYTLSRIGKGKCGKYISGLLNQGINELEYEYVMNAKVASFPSLQNGMILLMHIQQHLPLGLGFKQIIDWMMYVNECMDDEHWEIARDAYHKAGLCEPAMLVTKMCQMYLGLRKNDITWADSIPEEDCNKLLNYIFTKGNFGRKENQIEKGIFALTRDKNNKTRIRRLQKNGVKNWSAAEKHSCLAPFAWIYTLCTYFSFLIKREHPFRALIRDISVAQDRKKMFKKMNIYTKA